MEETTCAGQHTWKALLGVAPKDMDKKRNSPLAGQDSSQNETQCLFARDAGIF